MTTPLSRGLFVFGIMLFAAVIAYFAAPIEPSPRNNLAESDRAPIVVIDWLRTVVRPELSINSRNYNERLQSIERYFVQEGYRDYIIILQQAGIIHNLQNNNVSVDVSFNSVELANLGLKDGVFTWIFDVEMQLDTAFIANKISTPVRLFVLVSRNADADVVDGLKIRSLVLRNETPVSN